MGYRYFDSVGKEPLFPFGCGLSYTDFESSDFRASISGELVTVTAAVKNIGAYPGKEVMQLYVSIPEGKLDQPYQVLAGFAKTGVLAPGQDEQIRIRFSMSSIAPYDEETESYILEAGDYILRIGSSSRNTNLCAAVRVEDTVTVRQAKNVLGKPDFADYRVPEQQKKQSVLPPDAQILILTPGSITTVTTQYTRENRIDPAVEKLSLDQLIKMNLGAFDPKAGVASMIGNSGFTVAGAAGQTCMEAAGLPSMVMADGPAGLRLSRKFAVDAKGKVHPLESSIPASLLDFMNTPTKWIMRLLTYKPKKTDKPGEQYATALPIGTAIAQSFNRKLAEQFGKLVGEEMERFGVHLWLAPALNIHRSIRCGRNFEYYSEDPLVSGVFAAAITKGVQSFPHAGTTIKHYAFNNQERNRPQNNSQVSERAAREIYLKGFRICVRLAQPKAVMTSYNLVNGTHTSEHAGLIEDILRSEFGYQGIVMTDWVTTGYENEKDCIHPVAEAARVCMAGGDLFMPGSQHDYDSIKAGLDAGTVTKEQLRINASRVVRIARTLCK